MTLLLSHDPDSRKYVLDRLDREHIATIAERARVRLARGEAVELSYMPGDATWYSLVITPVHRTIGAPGGGHVKGSPVTTDYDQSYIGVYGPLTAYVIFHAQTKSGVFCSAEEDWEWITQEFNTTEASQLAIAELLKAVFDSQAAEKGES